MILIIFSRANCQVLCVTSISNVSAQTVYLSLRILRVNMGDRLQKKVSAKGLKRVKVARLTTNAILVCTVRNFLLLVLLKKVSLKFVQMKMSARIH